MNRIMKKLVPGVLAAALALGAVPSGITFDDIVAKADDDSYIVGYGGVLTDVLETKIQFYANSRVSKVTLKDPDDGSVVEVNPLNGSDNNFISCPLYPKNMHKEIILRMYDHAGNLLPFKKSSSSSDTVEEFVYTFNDYLDGLQTRYLDKKNNALSSITNLDRATYDLSRALENYGEWTRYYFAKKANYNTTVPEPKDGKFISYTTDSTHFDQPGYHPYYPSWWLNETEDGGKYWESDIDSYLNGRTFNDMLGNWHQPVVSLVNNKEGGLTEAEKFSHVYGTALVLDEGVRVRCFFTSQWTPGLIIKDIDNPTAFDAEGNPTQYASLRYGTFYSLNYGNYRYVDTELIPFGKMKDRLTFTFYGTWENHYDYTDTVTVSPMGYAKMIALDLAKTETGYESKGLGNTMRALATVETTAYLYNHPEVLGDSGDSGDSGSGN